MPSGSAATTGALVFGLRALPGGPCCPASARAGASSRLTPRVRAEIAKDILIAGLPWKMPTMWGSSLKASARRVIAAVNLRMAVLARPANHTWTLAPAEQGASRGLPIAVEGGVVADRKVVALLAQIRARRDEQLVVVGAVRRVTADAVL